VQDYTQREGKSPLIFSFLVKFIGVVPHEITNLLLGSLHIPYIKYLLGGILGLLPGMVATTVAGAHITNRRSLSFILAVVVMLFLMILSYYLSRRKKRK
jgi:uncharacterized membrane protein YdjX (TVP38/TMEM64 family)